MSRAILLMIAAVLAGCAQPDTLPVPPDFVVPPSPPQASPRQPRRDTALDAAPVTLKAALDRASPREAALVADPAADAARIARLRSLDKEARTAMADLERDGGRHVTAQAVKRMRDALNALNEHLDAFAPPIAAAP